MSQSIMATVAAAKAAVPSITVDDAAALRCRADVLFVDVRDAEEVAATGMIEGALNVSRGMLEFRADETTPYHNAAFAKDQDDHPQLRVGRSVRPVRQGAARSGLQRCPQSRRL